MSTRKRNVPLVGSAQPPAPTLVDDGAMAEIVSLLNRREDTQRELERAQVELAHVEQLIEEFRRKQVREELARFA